MKDIIYNLSSKYAAMFNDIIESDNENLLLRIDNTTPAVLAFYCAVHDMGIDIIGYESETIQIQFANMGLSACLAEKVCLVIAMINREDEVLSRADYFMYATSVVNYSSKFDPEDHNSSDEMIWTIVMLMAIFSASNNPLIGTALESLAAMLMSEGWTTPPFILSENKLIELFPYANKELQELPIKHKQRFFHIINPDAKYNIDNQYDNYFEMHKSLMFYIQQEDKSLTDRIIKLLG